jgi:hypothetical protein
LLESNDEGSPHPSRSTAMLFLFSIYGLRVSETAGLVLEDFDWVNETFTVRRAKRGRIQQFQIQFEVGQAILKYLKDERPICHSRYVFVILRPPFRRVGTPKHSKYGFQTNEDVGCAIEKNGSPLLKACMRDPTTSQGDVSTGNRGLPWTSRPTIRQHLCKA